MTRTSLVMVAMAAIGLPILAVASIPDPCTSTVGSAAGVLVACPRGDGPSLGSLGLTITIEVRDPTNVPVPNIPATDIWLIGCGDLLALCGGTGAINASGPTDAAGRTTITDSFAAGGCDRGVLVVVQGIIIDGPGCGQPCPPIAVRSPDINASLAVNVADLALFGAGYPSPPQAYGECLDFAAPYGAINLADFSKFGEHYQHLC
ncbi:MAG TPA: hypothetical protein VEC56_06865 [Candidatus Krumholzibacteria bacterium]|nr:hypothetical protein [Candidatus Krumholzibacteria bacterium]